VEVTPLLLGAIWSSAPALRTIAPLLGFVHCAAAARTAGVAGAVASASERRLLASGAVCRQGVPMDVRRLDGKVVMVTGATRGLGLARERRARQDRGSR